MKHNEGTVDRILRAVLGIGALVWAGSVGWTSGGGIVLLVLAVLLLGTAAIGFCPVYRAFGISTAPRAAQHRGDRAQRLARR